MTLQSSEQGDEQSFKKIHRRKREKFAIKFH